MIILIVLTATALIIRSIFTAQVEKSLTILTTRIQHDLRYENNKWNTTLYNADPLTPHPTGSSGFVTPLYIITTDGFVIERNQPVSGLLDTSDFKRLVTFDSAQTINAVTNESWRVLSQPIIKNNTTYGVVMVSYYNPITESQQMIDATLEENLNKIISKIEVKNSHVDASKIDVRTIDYDVSFEVVDTFNKVLSNNGRTPSFIDPSYVQKMMQGDSKEFLTDTKTNEKFLFVTKIVSDNKQTPRAIIVAGESVDYIDIGLKQYAPFGLILILLAAAASTLFIKKTFNVQALLKQASHKQTAPKSIKFDSVRGILLVNDESIDIPVDSHQHKILHALFSNPEKIWTQNELTENFHEGATAENNKKIYDAMLAINRKTPFKLIIYKDKTYSIEPSAVSLIS